LRYIFITKATKFSEAGVRPSKESIDAMNAFHEELAKAGVLRSAENILSKLQRSADLVRQAWWRAEVRTGSTERGERAGSGIHDHRREIHGGSVELGDKDA